MRGHIYNETHSMGEGKQRYGDNKNVTQFYRHISA